MGDARSVYMNAVKLYEDTFGVESLQGTPFLFDPVHPTDDDFLRAARIYTYMVRRKWRFTQYHDSELTELVY